LEAGIPARLSPAEGRKFAFTVGGAFLVLAAIGWWRHRALPLELFGGVGGLLVVLGVAVPGRLGPLHAAWMGMARAISKVTTPIFMGGVFFLVLTPIGLLMRLAGRRPMVHPLKDGGYWMTPPSGGRADMEHQF
jgi:hypothetical protein